MLSLWDSKVEPWDLKDRKFIYCKDVTFTKTLMAKTSSSQQVENKTNEILQ